jgi:hydroxymethylpyrimidine pyrophosphatase-like HAD family hydrolase
MIRGLRKQGAAWVINTGRSLSQTLQGLAQYGIFQEPDFIIAQECEIYKPGFFRQWTDLGAWNKQARKAHDHFLRDHAAFLKHIKNLVETQTRGQFLEGDLGQVGIVAHTDEELDAICELIEQHREQEPEVGYHRNGIYLRFSHSGYSKGSALGELARQLNLTPNECFAAGDNFNDLTMLDLSVARMIACPGNALPPVKAHVREQGGFIAQGIASTGMMEALQHFFGGAK